MRSDSEDASAFDAQERLLHRIRYLRRIRPGILAGFLQEIAVPGERRRIVRTQGGLRLYLDPLTHLGGATLTNRVYEPDTEQIFREHLHRGNVFLDVGANEGYFSALAGQLIGDEGLVIAIEPQTRLRDLIEINLRINDVKRFAIYRNALGGENGSEGVIHLWPTFQTGSSSLVRKYRFARATERFSFVSVERILNDQAVQRIDFAKVDVEGFEAEVVQTMLPQLRHGIIRKLLLDYHRGSLESRGIDPSTIHNSIVSEGYRPLLGDVTGLAGYVLYSAPPEIP